MISNNLKYNNIINFLLNKRDKKINNPIII